MAKRLQGCAKRVGGRARLPLSTPYASGGVAGRPGGYGAVLSEGPVRRLLFASLSGRVAFSMLPLGFVLFAVGETGSNATAGAMVAGVHRGERAGAGARADRRPPRRHRAGAVRVRVLGRRSPALVVAAALGAPSWVLVALSGARRARPAAARARSRARPGGSRCATRDLQRAFALDSAGEEGALIVAPLLVSVAVAIASPRAALLIAARRDARGTVAAGRSRLGARIAPSERARGPTARGCRRALWLLLAALAGTAAALGAIDVAVPAAAREAGHVAAAGVLLAVMAVGTVAGSLLAGARDVALAAASGA